MSSVAHPFAPTNIISIILNSSPSQAVRPPKQMHRTCASCRQRQAQPFRVLGRYAPPEPYGSVIGNFACSDFGKVECPV